MPRAASAVRLWGRVNADDRVITSADLAGNAGATQTVDDLIQAPLGVALGEVISVLNTTTDGLQRLCRLL